jgi:hypothetical protein
LFFLLQAASVNYTRDANAKTLLRRALRDLPKVILISIPVIILGVALAYILARLQARFGLPPDTIPASTYPVATPPPTRFTPSSVLFTAVRLLLLGVMLPLLTIHVWLAVVRRGIGATVRNFGGILRSAFAAGSVTIYTLGLLVFALLPYFLIFTRTPVASPWLELIIFGVRLALTFALTLAGWVVTVGALAIKTYDELPPALPAPGDAVQATPPPRPEVARATT